MLVHIFCVFHANFELICAYFVHIFCIFTMLKSIYGHIYAYFVYIPIIYLHIFNTFAHIFAYLLHVSAYLVHRLAVAYFVYIFAYLLHIWAIKCIWPAQGLSSSTSQQHTAYHQFIASQHTHSAGQANLAPAWAPGSSGAGACSSLPNVCWPVDCHFLHQLGLENLIGQDVNLQGLCRPSSSSSSSSRQATNHALYPAANCSRAPSSLSSFLIVENLLVLSSRLRHGQMCPLTHWMALLDAQRLAKGRCQNAWLTMLRKSLPISFIILEQPSESTLSLSRKQKIKELLCVCICIWDAFSRRGNHENQFSHMLTEKSWKINFLTC